MSIALRQRMVERYEHHDFVAETRPCMISSPGRTACCLDPASDSRPAMSRITAMNCRAVTAGIVWIEDTCVIIGPSPR
jgi:hypothetical protein